MRAAVIHEWVENIGGSERVVEAMLKVLPASDLYCLWKTADSDSLTPTDTTWLARSPLRGHKALSLPFMPYAWRRLVARSDYDFVLISSHLFAHHARFRNIRSDIPRLAYVHTPARYIWAPEQDSRGRNLGIRAAAAVLKPLDRARARELDAIAVNSKYVADRVRDSWGLESEVIYPPVNTKRISDKHWQTTTSTSEEEQLRKLPEKFFLGASRFVEYKRLEKVIEAAEIAQIPAVIAGSGPDEARLREISLRSSVPVLFIGQPTDRLLYALYDRATAFVFPAVEDFGIMPVEAMAAGTPVLGNRVGGVTESVVDGNTGALVDFDTPASIAAGIEKIGAISPIDCTNRAEEFSFESFAGKLVQWIEAVIGSSRVLDMEV